MTAMSTIQQLKNFIRHGMAPPRDPLRRLRPRRCTLCRPVDPAALATSCDPPVFRSSRPPVHCADLLTGKQARAVEENEKVADAAPAPPPPPEGGPPPPHEAAGPQVARAPPPEASKSKRINESNIAKLVAEENESKSKFPRYPGLERWKLLEKMGDGAFSNVYRALDLHGHHGEAAIKVVRKFEMNSMQVSQEAGVTALAPTTGASHRSLSSCDDAFETFPHHHSPYSTPNIPFFPFKCFVLPTRGLAL